MLEDDQKLQLSHNIVRYRKIKGMTQKQLADALEVSTSRVSNWEQGINLPSSGMMVALSKILSVSTDALYGVTPEEAAIAQESALFDYLSTLEVIIKHNQLIKRIEKVYDNQGNPSGELYIPDTSPDKPCCILYYDGKELHYTNREFKAFQAEIEQSIEYQLWKKNQSR